MDWALDNFEIVLNLLQTIAIVVTLVITLFQLRSGVKMNRASISLALTESHREIWSYFINNKDLARIRQENLDLEIEPPTFVEEYFVVMVANHMSAAFDAHREGVHRAYPSDMKAFFSRPIPKRVWENIRDYQPTEFATYIDKLLGEDPPGLGTRFMAAGRRSLSKLGGVVSSIYLGISNRLKAIWKDRTTKPK